MFRTVCCRFCSTHSCIECYLACSCQGVFAITTASRSRTIRSDGLLYGRKLRDSNRKDGGRRTELEERKEQHGLHLMMMGIAANKNGELPITNAKTTDWVSSTWTVTISRHPSCCNCFSGYRLLSGRCDGTNDDCRKERTMYLQTEGSTSARRLVEVQRYGSIRRCTFQGCHIHDGWTVA